MPQLQHRDYDLFFSYSHRDRETVRALADAFREKGFGVFLDVWNLPQKPGDIWDWTVIVEVALSKSKAGVIFFSPAALKSKWVRTESIRLANKAVLKPSFVVIPIRLQPCPVPSFVGQEHVFDLFDHSAGALAGAADEIISALRREAGRKVERAAAQTAAEAAHQQRAREAMAVPAEWFPSLDETRTHAVSIAYKDSYLYVHSRNELWDGYDYDERFRVSFSLSRVPPAGWREVFLKEISGRYEVIWNPHLLDEMRIMIGAAENVKSCVRDVRQAVVFANRMLEGE